jgi:hypothetical protein
MLVNTYIHARAAYLTLFFLPPSLRSRCLDVTAELCLEFCLELLEFTGGLHVVL